MDDEMSQKESVEIEQSIASLSSVRRGRLGVCTRRINEVKALLAAGDDLDSIKKGVKTFFVVLNEFKTAHKLVQEQLPDDIRENERIDWFEPKMATFENFMSELERWKNVQKDPQTLIEPNDSASNVSKRSHKSRSSHSSSI